jgi:hypothetical protein
MRVVLPHLYCARSDGMGSVSPTRPITTTEGPGSFRAVVISSWPASPIRIEVWSLAVTPDAEIVDASH